VGPGRGRMRSVAHTVFPDPVGALPQAAATASTRISPRPPSSCSGSMWTRRGRVRAAVAHGKVQEELAEPYLQFKITATVTKARC
jgi:hypothetical protein